MILVDADIIAYKVGHVTGDVSEKYALSSLQSAVSRWLTSAVTVPYFLDNVLSYNLYITGKGNFRKEVFPEYKANRIGKEKPKHLSAIMSSLVTDWSAIVAEGEEADDLIGIESTRLLDKCLIVTIDKDFDQLQGYHFNPDKDIFYYVSAWEGTVFFYKQILTGDRVDNIIGLYGVGEKKSSKMLEACETELELYNNCVAIYKEREDLTDEEAESRILVVARLLWLRRYDNQMWGKPE